MTKATAPAEDVPTAAPVGLPVPEPTPPPPEAKPATRSPRPLSPAPFGRAAYLSPDHKGELSLRFRTSWLPTFPAPPALARAEFLQQDAMEQYLREVTLHSLH